MPLREEKQQNNVLFEPLFKNPGVQIKGFNVGPSNW